MARSKFSKDKGRYLKMDIVTVVSIRSTGERLK